MPIIDASERLLSLRCVVGPDRATIAPDTYTVHLFDGDPVNADPEFDPASELAATTELDEGPAVNGYAPATVSADDFTFDGEIATVLAEFTPTEEWAATATHFLLRNGSADSFSGALLEPLDVTAAGAPFNVACSIFIDDAVDDPA